MSSEEAVETVRQCANVPFNNAASTATTLLSQIGLKHPLRGFQIGMMVFSVFGELWWASHKVAI